MNLQKNHYYAIVLYQVVKADQHHFSSGFNID